MFYFDFFQGEEDEEEIEEEIKTTQRNDKEDNDETQENGEDNENESEFNKFSERIFFFNSHFIIIFPCCILYAELLHKTDNNYRTGRRSQLKSILQIISKIQVTFKISFKI